jgi:hypothetical protein
MSSQAARISRPFRVALGAKGVLLLALSALFVVIADLAELLAFRAVGATIAIFLAWASSLAFVDAIGGEAIREFGARPLASRWTGRSLRTPSGRFVEFVLWNPWDVLDATATYTVTYGSRSGVIVERPEIEPGPCAVA